MLGIKGLMWRCTCVKMGLEVTTEYEHHMERDI
jgi:hypothetical protein